MEIARVEATLGEAAGISPSHDEQQFRQLADDAPVMIWRSNTARRCDYFNRHWLSFTGRRLQDEVGLGWIRGIRPQDYQRCIDTFMGSIAGRIPFTLDYHLRRHDGEYRWILSNGVPYHRHGRFSGFLGSCVDISESGERRRSAATAGNGEAMRNLNHRIKNSLQTSLCFSAFGLPMGERGSQSELSRLTERLSLLALVHEEVSRVGVGSGVDFCEFLTALAEAIRTAVGNPNVRLSVACEPAMLSKTRATAIGTIVDELLTRALTQAFPEHRPGTIRVESRPLPDDRIELSISEDGFAPTSHTEPARQSYERQLLERLTAHAHGTIRYELAPERRSVITLEPE